MPPTRRRTSEIEGRNKKARLDDDQEEEERTTMTSSPPRIPVTILSGFLGSGKTTLLKHVLTSKEHNLKIAVIVNDMAELNIDGQTIMRTSEIVKTKKEVVTLENGCICCTLRGDLIREINRIQEQQQFDYVLIESTGIAEPQQVAESFCVDPETLALAGNDESMLWNAARLDTCVTVVDALNFPSYLSSLKRFQEVFRDGLDDAEEGEGEKSISELMVEQVEFANVIILNKVDLVSEEKLQDTKRLLQSLNPKARIISGSYGKIDLQQILNTRLFNMQDAQDSPGWLVSLKDGANASSGEADEYGVTSFVYRQRKPFHPKRLHCFLTKLFCFAEDWNSGLPAADTVKDDEVIKRKYGTIYRSKGTCWIAGRDDHEMSWAQTGPIVQILPTAPWYCKTPPEEWEDSESEEGRARIEALFHEPNDETSRFKFGDRRNEIVFIGTYLQQATLEDALNRCLLTEDEMKHHTACLPTGTYPDPLLPVMVACQGSASLFMILRSGQSQHIHIFPGSKLTLQNIALNFREDDYTPNIRAVRVWLDKTDDTTGHGILLATLRPETCEQYPICLELLPCDKEGGEEDSHRRIRVEVVPNRQQQSTVRDDDWMEIFEVHVSGTVEPLSYAEDTQEGEEEEEEEEDNDCHDGMCSGAA